MNKLPLARSGKTAIEVAVQAAREAGEIILERFHSIKDIKHKGKSNIVTEVDILSEKLIMRRLVEEYPDFKIISEETNSATEASGFTWIVDPLDGTNNYAYGIPFFCINIAMTKNQDILLGVTYDPLRQELFHTEKGKGAYLNRSPIHVSKAKSLDEALMAIDLGYSHEKGRELLDITHTFLGRYTASGSLAQLR